MAKGVALFVLAVGAINAAQGLRCWKCSAYSRSECLSRGSMETCQRGQRMSCATYIRYGDGPTRQAMIMKGCKQKDACENEARQNQYQCIPGESRRNCRCCCQNNRCNRKNFWCTADPQCDLLPQPQLGVKECQFNVSEGEVGSKCTFSCYSGHQLVGSNVSICEQTDQRVRFSSPAPKCVNSYVFASSTATPPRRVPTESSTTTLSSVASTALDSSPSVCETVPEAPSSGSYSCRRTRKGLECTYFCGENERMEGMRVLICRKSSGWNGVAPKCIRNDVECDSLPLTPSDGSMKCSANGAVGTVCTFSCRRGFVLIGVRSTRCILREGTAKWSSETPICENRRNILRLSDDESGEPTDDEDGIELEEEQTRILCWECNDARSESACNETGRMVLCQSGESCRTEVRYGVDEEVFESISMGCKQNEACMNERKQNKRDCVFGRPNSVCRCCCDENGCNSNNITCADPRDNRLCDDLPELRNGMKHCSQFEWYEGEVGTNCTFTCYQGYQLEGASESVCTESTADGIPQFSNPIPVCKEMQRTSELALVAANSICENPPPPSPRGDSRCTQSEEGMTCTYFCGQDEALIGNEVISCTHMEGWNGTAPLCIPKCAYMPSNPENGERWCDGNGEINTICQFECDYGFLMVGPESISCLLEGDRARWSQEPPICERREDSIEFRLADAWFERADLVLGALTGPEEHVLQPLVEADELVGTEQCWECLNAQSESQCLEEGKNVTCQAEMWCKTEIRYAAAPGGMPMITKGCKRIKACQDEEPQNKHDCKTNKLHAVCRCCCAGDNCNTQNFWCGGTGGNARCEVLPKPTDGTKSCNYSTYEGEVGTKCTFACDEGFNMEGEAESQCNEVLGGGKPQFSNGSPSCAGAGETGPTESGEISPSVVPVVPRTRSLPAERREIVEDCQTPLAPPLTGGNSCVPSDGAMVCEFYCGEGESLVGPAIVGCTVASGWNGTTPTCAPMCTELPPAPANGGVACSGDGELGTVCDFLCNTGYRLVGMEAILCGRLGEEATWSADPPTCSRVEEIPVRDLAQNDELDGELPSVTPVVTLHSDEESLLDSNQTLKCWECIGAHSETECVAEGQLVACQTETSCLTEIRFAAGAGKTPIIFMGCKQALACENDQLQNKNDCVLGRLHPVCRCCCSEDSCNSDNFWCAGPGGNNFCDLLPDLANGTKECAFDFYEGEIGSRCSFSCNPGFLLDGFLESVCSLSEGSTKPQFSSVIPICVEDPSAIASLPITETNGTLQCWECKNAKSQRQCMEEGSLVTCDPGMTCKTEIRYGSGTGGSIMVTMGCKQLLACENEKKLNEIECTPGTPNALCRCCCSESNCNYDNFWCAAPQEYTFDEEMLDRITVSTGGEAVVQCWECKNALSESQCRSEGRMVTCGNWGTCRTEIRYGVGPLGEPVISMGCKQAAACLNEVKQNVRECNITDPNPVCRCCCNENSCNQLNFWCAGPGEPILEEILDERTVPPPVNETTLECWECLSAESETECLENGTMVACMPGEECKTVIRYGAGPGGAAVITMGCKQTEACENEKKQNINECLADRPNAVCRCCCDESGCNADNFWCAGPGDPGCDRLPDLLNGVKKCEFTAFEGEIGAVCTFTCNPTFILEGEAESVCLNTSEGEKPVFSSPTPICRGSEMQPTLTPTPVLTTPASPGDFRCPAIPPIDRGSEACDFVSDPNELGSTCYFSCQAGYELIGDPEIVCLSTDSGPVWSTSFPVCELSSGSDVRGLASCGLLPPTPLNSVGGCNGTGEVGTVCGYICNVGHAMLGCPSFQCIFLNGRALWTAAPPTCVEIISVRPVPTTTTTTPPRTTTTTTTTPPTTTTTTTPPTTTTTTTNPPTTTTTTTNPPTTTTTTTNPPSTTTTTTNPPTTTTTTTNPPTTTTTTTNPPTTTTTTTNPPTTTTTTTNPPTTTTTTTNPPTTTTTTPNPPTTTTTEAPTTAEETTTTEPPPPVLRCWECTDAETQSACLREGRTAKCEGEDARCWTELRYVDGALTVSKGCKTAGECAALIASTADRCNGGTDDSFCNCCCDDYRCNRRNFWCADDSLACEVLEPPPYGTMDCEFNSFEGEIGTRCLFACEEGYELDGKPSSACVQWKRGEQPRFVNEPPVCRREETAGLAGPIELVQDFGTSTGIRALDDCDSPPLPPPNGSRQCFLFGGRRICSYSCADDEIMIGTGVVACSLISGWDGPTPQCISMLNA